MHPIELYARSRHYLKVCLGISKDQLLKKFPDQKEAIEFFFQRAPNGNPKYVEWQLKVLMARQAQKEEIADVIALFDKFRNRLQKKDIFQYQVSDFTGLRDQLFALRDEQQGRRQERQQKVEKRYHNEPEAIACGHKIIYDSEDLKCIQITNKAASMHYGMGTKWCITMKDQSYFEDYDKSNVVFFFIFNKHLNKDSRYYKVAFAYQRGTNNEILGCDHFDAEDQQFDSAHLANQYLVALRDTYNDKAYSHYKEELSKLYSMMLDIAKSYPKSLLARIYSNEVPVDEVIKIYEQEKNSDIKKALEKWLLQNEQKIPQTIIEEIASLTTDINDIHTLSRSKSPIVLDKLFDNISSRPDDKGYIRYLASNEMLSEHTIEKIFNWKTDEDQYKYNITISLLALPNCPVSKLIEYSNDVSDHYARQYVAANDKTPQEIIDKLIIEHMSGKSHSTKTYINALQNPNASPDLLKKAFSKDQRTGHEILKNPNAPKDLIRQIYLYSKALLSNHAFNPTYYKLFANNKNTPSDILEDIYHKVSRMDDTDEILRIESAIAHNPNTPKGLVEGYNI